MTAVLVTGATGNVGSAVVAELTRRRAGVRAFVRDAAAARALLGDDVELAVGELGDGESVARALDGVDRVFLACGNVPGQVEYETGVVDAAARAGVRRIVKLSAGGARAGSPLVFWDWHGRIEEHLAASGVPAVVLRPTSYMTNLLASAGAIAGGGRLFAPADEARVAMIDPRDVAAVAAAALTDARHEGETYVLTGPQALGFVEIAAALSQATGRTIEFVDVSDDDARRGLLAAGMPELLADFLVGLFAAQRAGAHATTTDTVRSVTGAQPRGIAEFAREHAAAFGGVPVAR